tara:strand:- start:54 stop:635 length:582 start_codon:yes stop_codon:yes gene_type:complete
MRIFLCIFFLLNLYNCASTNEEIIIPGNEINSKHIKSCTGRGSITSIGSINGRLSYNFMSQNDSLFCQFQDFLGRKVLLLWLTQDSIDAWNLIDNKKYNYSDVSSIIPILSVLNPNYLIKFLWGQEITSNQINNPNHANIEVKLGRNNKNNSIIDKATFIDKSNRQEFSIKIDSRVFNENYLDLKKYWKIILS